MTIMPTNISRYKTDLEKKTPFTGKLTRPESEALKYTVKKLGIAPQTAYQLLFNDEPRERYLKYHRMVLDIDLIDSIDKMQKILQDKLEEGDITESKNMAVALSILRQRLFQEVKETKNQIQVGQGVNVNIGFQFKPYGQKIKQKAKELREISEDSNSSIVEDNTKDSS